MACEASTWRRSRAGLLDGAAVRLLDRYQLLELPLAALDDGFDALSRALSRMVMSVSAGILGLPSLDNGRGDIFHGAASHGAVPHV